MSYYDPTILESEAEESDDKNSFKFKLRNIDGTVYTPKMNETESQMKDMPGVEVLPALEEEISVKPMKKLLKLNLDKDRDSIINDSRYKNSGRTIPSYSPNKKLMYDNLDSILGGNDFLDITLEDMNDTIKSDAKNLSQYGNRSSFKSYHSLRNTMYNNPTSASKEKPEYQKIQRNTWVGLNNNIWKNSTANSFVTDIRKVDEEDGEDEGKKGCCLCNVI